MKSFLIAAATLLSISNAFSSEMALSAQKSKGQTASQLACQGVVHLACADIKEGATLQELTCGNAKQIFLKDMTVNCSENRCAAEFSEETSIISVQFSSSVNETMISIEDKVSGQSQNTSFADATNGASPSYSTTTMLTNKKGGLLGMKEAYAVVVSCGDKSNMVDLSKK